MPILPPNERRGAHADAATPRYDETIRLRRIQERLAELSTEACSVRAQLPRDYEPGVESVQQQMEFLGDRLAELNAGSAPLSAPAETTEAGWAEYCDKPDEKAGEVAGTVNRVSPAQTAFEQYEVTTSSGPVEPADLWDEASVAELFRLYESGEANLTGGARADDVTARQQAAAAKVSASSWPAQKMQGSAASIEPTSLEQRFAEISQRIEQSLAEIRPESSLLKIGQRFDQLEERITSALEGVATRTNVEELRRAEAQVEEISAQFGDFRAQLARLETIDAHLGTLTEQLSDEKMIALLGNASSSAIDSARLDAVDAQLTSISEQLSDERFSELAASHATQMPDAEDLAASAAEKMAERFANHELWEAQSRDLGEVRGLVENLINERRINDENNASMLETMQQAIIRVFDRIDALELAQQSAAPAMAASEPAPAEAEPAMEAEPATSSKMEAEQSSYVSLTHPQPEPAMEAEPTTSSGSKTEESNYVSLTHPQPQPEAELSQGKAFADLGDEMIYEPPPFLRSEGRPSYAATLDERQDEPYTPPGSTPISDEAPLTSSAFFADTGDSDPDAESEETGSSKPTALSIDELRQNLIAEAHRAKLRVASKPEGVAESEEPIAANDAGKPSKTKRASRKLAGMIMTTARMSARRIWVGALVLLLIVPAAIFLMPRSASDADGVSAPEAVRSISAPKGAAEPRATGPDSGNAVAPKQTNKVMPDAGTKGDAEKDAGEPPAKPSPGRVDTASIPHGIMLLEHYEPNSDQIVRAQQAQGMAFLSNQLGIAAAKATPASLMQEYILAQHPGPNRPNGQALTGSGNSLKLPPATVGPFSLRLAAAQGIASAQFEVAARLAKGDVTEQNLEAAARWYNRSASQGFAMAQYRLGTLYERGLGVKADLARAKIWYRRAAQQGNLKAMHNLAVLSASREGRTVDYAAAAQWFSQAAERGLADSQYNLAMLYESGLGVPQDLKQAYKWFLLASKSGDAEAERRRKVLTARLSVADRAQAEKLARSWRAKASDPMLNDARVAGQAWQHSAHRASRG